MSEAFTSPFDAIKHEDDFSSEFWSARELSEVLGYARWENFAQAITRAQIACETSGHAVSDHFRDVTKLVTAGSGAKRRIKDFHLSRYACYLIVQNGDPDKAPIALGQTYFAVQTREQELTRDLIAQMNEDQKRLFLRAELERTNRRLAATATGAGVVKPRDYAIFYDHGYKGLYDKTSAALHEQIGLANFAARSPLA